MILEDIRKESNNIQKKFPHKNILFIGSESYDAPTITVIEGLHKLGFNIYTLGRGNINSWFCNKIINKIDGLHFDFVLSNLHWGTRWSHYERYNLHDYTKILIDGDDNVKGFNWLEKYEYYKSNYRIIKADDNIEEKLKDQCYSFRWVEEMGKYKPDIVFTAQKQIGDKVTHYLPFGIHNDYIKLFENKDTQQRQYFLSHIDGPGLLRKKMYLLLNLESKIKLIPNVFNGSIRGEAILDSDIKCLLENDADNIHSYHRWQLNKDYFHLLNNSKIVVYPGIDTHPFWDSKRPWEAIASGALLLYQKPNIDISEYPITDLSNFVEFSNHVEFIYKASYLKRNNEFLSKLRQEFYRKGMRYFTSEPISSYFLHKIYEKKS